LSAALYCTDFAGCLSLSLSLSLSTKIKQNALMMKLFKKKKRVKEHWEVGALQPDTL
jgi:hypothetical protein